MVTELERYLFDLNGYVVVPGVLDATEVERLNAIIDDSGVEHPAEVGIWYLRHEPFRSLIDHPRILPYLHEWTAWASVDTGGEPQLRVDHIQLIVGPGGLSGHLHHGNTPYEPPTSYEVRGGKIFSTLTVVSFALSEVPPGQGGLALIPGSHKSNFPCPIDFTDGKTPYVVSPRVEPGDAVIFTESLTHGALPWSAPHQRRAVMYKYSPGYMTWIHPRWPQELIDLCTPEQQKLLRPPYVADAPVFFDDEPREQTAVT
jgi:hypothetical protein